MQFRRYCELLQKELIQALNERARILQRAQVSELRRQAEAEADPARKEALTAQANQLSAKAFTPIYDREKLWVDLEADKAARLQKIITEEIAKYDAAHQG